MSADISPKLRWIHQTLTSGINQFSFQNSFSGQTLFESWTLTFYNVLFSVRRVHLA
jgi:hypothetical protein